MADVFSLIVQNRSEIFKDIGNRWDSLNNDAQRAVQRKLDELNKEKTKYLDGVFERSTTTACVICLSTASLKAQKRVWELAKRHFNDLDFSEIWNDFCESLADTAAVVGAGAAVGGTIGGIVTLGPGAIPGAIIGAKVSLAIYRSLGLIEAGIKFVTDLTRCCGQLSDGFRLAWSAGLIPMSRPGHERTKRMQQAVELIAQGEFGLMQALFSAISDALLRSPNKGLLIGKLNESKLGKGFARWFDGSHGKIKGHLPQDAKGGVGVAPKAPPPVAPKVENPKPGVDTVTQSGEAEKGCAECPLVGAPVSPIFGCKILSGDTELDFALAAPLPLVWQRIYSSAQAKTGWLGQGWWTPISESLYISNEEVVVQDAHDRRITFSLPQVDHSIYSPSEKITLYRSGPREFEIVDADLERRVFAMPTGAYDHAQLVSVVDANGNTIRILYGARQLPERIIDSAGREYILAFSEQRGQIRLTSIGKLHQPKDGTPATESDLLVQYDYNDVGDLIAVRNRIGEVVRQFVYRKHIMIEHSQPGGVVSRYEYDEYHHGGKVLRNWTNNGQSWDFRYLGNETVVTDNLGRETRYQFDERKRFISEVDACGGITKRELDQYGNLLSITDPAGRGSTFRYDERGRVIRIESAGSGTGIVYDSRFDKPALVTDAMGATTAMRYDSRGNLRCVTNALGRQTTYEYDEQGLPIRVIDARGGIKRLTYNSSGQLTVYMDCSGYTTQYYYDEWGRLVRIKDPTGNKTDISYNQIGLPNMVRLEDGKTDWYEYDSLGRLTVHRNTLGHQTTYLLDNDGKPLKRTDPSGRTFEYRYDSARRLIELINETGNFHIFHYDALDRLAEERTFDARRMLYRYDTCGNLIQKSELGSSQEPAAQIQTDYSRDGAGRLLKKIISGKAVSKYNEKIRTNFQYDAIGRVTHATNTSAITTLEYDLLGQLISEVTKTNGIETKVQNVYDELGNKSSTILPDGRRLNYLYHGAGNLHQINIDGDLITDIERDRNQRATSKSQGTLSTNIEYDSLGRVISQSIYNGETVKSYRRYKYNIAGNLETFFDSRNGSCSYEYDLLDRITTAINPTTTEIFEFDPIKNITPGENSQATTAPSKSWDSHGNLTQKALSRNRRLDLEWNSAHQLARSRQTRIGRETNRSGRATNYQYDAFGRRIRKLDKFATTEFVWDGDLLLIEFSSKIKRLYIYEPFTFIPIAQVSSIAGNVSSSKDSGQTLLHIHCDHLGTPVELTYEDGSVAHNAQYLAWGTVRLTLANSSNAVDTGATPPIAQPIRFQGQYYDQETGLHYNRHRYYDPGDGTYISPDPIGLLGGENCAQYAPNPTGWIDPLGLQADCGQCGSAGNNIPGRVRSRINLANKQTRNTPDKKNGKPWEAGIEHIIDGHFNQLPTNRTSVFTISPEELKTILQSPEVVQSKVTVSDRAYKREVDVGRIIGLTRLKDGWRTTSVIRIFTDKAGNILTAFPVRG